MEMGIGVAVEPFVGVDNPLGMKRWGGGEAIHAKYMG